MNEDCESSKSVVFTVKDCESRRDNLTTSELRRCKSIPRVITTYECEKMKNSKSVNHQKTHIGNAVSFYLKFCLKESFY